MSYMPTTLPSNPSLLALLFLVRTRTGPRFVAHYPTSPEDHWHTAHSALHHRSSSTSSSSTSSSASSSGSDDHTHAPNAPPTRPRQAGSKRGTTTRETRKTRRSDPEADEADEDEDEDVGNMSGPSQQHSNERRSGAGSAAGAKHGDSEAQRRARRRAKEWEDVLGFDAEGLAKLLCPAGRSWHKRCFELAMEDVVFVSCPVFGREDGGGWGKRKRKTAKAGTKNAEATDGSAEELHPYEDVWGERTGEVSEGEVSEKSSSSKGRDEQMTMFNTVFVMSPLELEHQLRVKEMYDNVVKDLAKAMRRQQKHCGYVWHEAQSLLSLREKAKETGASVSSVWPEMLASSSLAKALATVFDSISASKIAHVHLGDGFDISLQIPQPTSTRFAPTPTASQSPGLPLTTFDPTDGLGTGLVDICPHSALLLLRSASTLIKEIESDTAAEPSPSLTYYLRNSTPTKSLQKLSKMYHIPIQDIQFLSCHLIQWRRARAIPPLRAANTYIVSPNADFRRLPEATASFGRRFAALPSLPNLLAKIGRTPREYAALIPSKDHTPAYMDILAWLMRDGWVTQLRTFAWIKVSVEVKMAVTELLEREEATAAAQDQEDGHQEEGLETGSSISAHRLSDESRGAKLASVIPSRLAPHLLPPRPKSDAGSVSSGRTAVPISDLTDRPTSTPKPGLAADKGLPRPSSQQSTILHSSFDGSGDANVVESTAASNFEASVITSPHKANALESRWIEHIGASLEDSELRKMWPSLVKYFDGNNAFEDIAVKEGLKRKLISGWLDDLVHRDLLMVVRHW